MDIAMDAAVFCADGQCGTASYVVLNPATERMTHLVVKETHFPHTEWLVPIDLVTKSTPDKIQLRCSRKELAGMEPFMVTEFVKTSIPEYDGAPVLWWPYATMREERFPMEHERIPYGELTVHRGTRVDASDGEIGRVDEFLIDPADDKITHLVLREGYLWGQKDVTIPVSQIDEIDDEAVHLKLTRQEVEALPKLPVKHWW